MGMCFVVDPSSRNPDTGSGFLPNYREHVLYDLKTYADPSADGGSGWKPYRPCDGSVLRCHRTLRPRIAILKKYGLMSNPALVLLGKIVNGADTDNTLYQQPEGPGLEAIAEGFRHLCQEMVR
jgi:hypothetical protein